MLGPERKPMIFVADRQKGIRFLFHQERTDTRYRVRFWRNFSQMAAELQRRLEEHNAPTDPPYPGGEEPCCWWVGVMRWLSRAEFAGTGGGVAAFQPLKL